MKKSLSFALLIFVMFVVIRLVGITYGFYSTRIIENANEHSLLVSSSELSVIYADGTSKMNFEGDYLFPGNTAEKSFTVENRGDDTATYSVLIDNVVNEFERTQDLRYFLYIDEDLVSEGAINTNEIQYLYYDKEILVDEKQNIKLVFEYATTDEIQNMDMNKNLSFRVNISAASIKTNENTNGMLTLSTNSELNNYRIYGNSVQDGVPSIDAPVEIESVGNLITDEANDNYGMYEIPIIVSGKNLIPRKTSGNVTWMDSTGLSGTHNADGSITLNGGTSALSQVGNARLSSVNNFEIRNSGEVTLYCEGANNSVYLVLGQRDVDTNTTSFVTCKGNSVTFSVKKGDIIIPYLQIAANATVEETTLYFQLEYGSNVTDYEEYVEPKSYSIYLDEPLRKIGDYADYIDFKRQVVVRNVESLNYNVSDMNNSESYPGWKYNEILYEDFPNENIKLDKVSNGVLSNITTDTNLIGINTTSTGKVLSFDTNVINLTQTEWQTKYPQLNINVQYVKPMIKEKMIKLPSFDFVSGTSVIAVNTSVSPSNVIVEYHSK